MSSKAHPPQRCAFVIRVLMAMTAVSLSVPDSPCVATEGTVHFKPTYRRASVTMVLTGVRVKGVFRSLLDLNARNVSQTTLAGQSDATSIVSMAMAQGQTKISARATMIPT